MMMKKLLTIVVLFLCAWSHSQEETKLGSLVFDTCKFMGNKHLKPSEAEIKKNKKRFREFIKNNIDSKKPDEFINSLPKSELEVFGDSMKCAFKLDIYKDYFTLKETCNYINKTTIERYKQIDRKTLEFSVVTRNKETNQYKISPKNKPYFPTVPDKYELIEYRNETKNILGYKCYKVLMRNKSDEKQNLITYDFEMYVTDEISINYNPITRYKDVLEKYYPLEIVKKTRKEVMAEVIVWKVRSIDLENVKQ